MQICGDVQRVKRRSKLFLTTGTGMFYSMPLLLQMLTNANPLKTCAIRCVLIASTLLVRIIVAVSQATKEMASIAHVGASLLRM